MLKLQFLKPQVTRVILTALMCSLVRIPAHAQGVEIGHGATEMVDAFTVRPAVPEALHIWLDGNAQSRLSGYNWASMKPYITSCYGIAGIPVVWDSDPVASQQSVQNFTAGSLRDWGGGKTAKLLKHDAVIPPAAKTQWEQSDYKTVIITDAVSWGGTPPDTTLAHYTVWKTTVGLSDWECNASRPGLVSIIATNFDAARDEIQGTEGDIDRYLANCLVHELYHCGAQSTNNDHCARNVATCVINKGAGPAFGKGLRKNTVYYRPPDGNGWSIIKRSPWHSISELDRIAKYMTQGPQIGSTNRYGGPLPGF